MRPVQHFVDPAEVQRPSLQFNCARLRLGSSRQRPEYLTAAWNILVREEKKGNYKQREDGFHRRGQEKWRCSLQDRWETINHDIYDYIHHNDPFCNNNSIITYLILWQWVLIRGCRECVQGGNFK